MEPKAEQLNAFSLSIDKMIATSERSYDKYASFRKGFKHREHTKEEIQQILQFGDSEQLEDISLNFLYSSGFYRRTLCHYASILKYSYIFIPTQKKRDTDFSTDKNKERYFDASQYLEELNLRAFGPYFALRVLLRGAYYGVIRELDDGIGIQDLPNHYCRSRFKGEGNIPIVEFNVQYFDTIIEKKVRDKVLRGYPKEFRRAYNNYKNRGGDNWVLIELGLGLYFTLIEERPFFLDMIPAIMDFEEYREIEKKKDMQDLKKILVQRLPLDKDDEMAFEPEEAEEMHRGTVQMMKNNSEVDVITSFAEEIKVEDLQSSRAVVTNNLEKIENTVYSEAGVSKALFTATTGSALTNSIENDVALMAMLAEQISNWATYHINHKFQNVEMGFKVTILPVSHYNTSTFFKEAIQGAQYGYSFIMPFIAWGLNQNDLVNLKKAERDILGLSDLMKPLKSSYTQSGDETDSDSGRPVGDDTEVTDKTLQNREAQLNNG